MLRYILLFLFPAYSNGIWKMNNAPFPENHYFDRYSYQTNKKCSYENNFNLRGKDDLENIAQIIWKSR